MVLFKRYIVIDTALKFGVKGFFNNFAIPIWYGTLAEWLGNGLQNREQQFDSAGYLKLLQVRCQGLQLLKIDI